MTDAEGPMGPSTFPVSIFAYELVGSESLEIPSYSKLGSLFPETVESEQISMSVSFKLNILGVDRDFYNIIKKNIK